MKKSTIAIVTTATALLLGSTVLAGPVEDLIAKLEAEGYQNIEVETEDGQIEIEGVLGDMEREITLDEVTGEVLSDETEPVDDDDDDEDDDDEDDADDDAN